MAAWPASADQSSSPSTSRSSATAGFLPSPLSKPEIVSSPTVQPQRAVHDGHALVSQLAQVVDGLPRPGSEVHRHEVQTLEGLRRREEHHGHPARHDELQELRVSRLLDDHSIHLFQERPEGLHFLRIVIVEVGEQSMAPGTCRLPFDPQEYVEVERFGSDGMSSCFFLANHVAEGPCGGPRLDPRRGLSCDESALADRPLEEASSSQREDCIADGRSADIELYRELPF